MAALRLILFLPALAPGAMSVVVLDHWLQRRVDARSRVSWLPLIASPWVVLPAVVMNMCPPIPYLLLFAYGDLTGPAELTVPLLFANAALSVVGAATAAIVMTAARARRSRSGLPPVALTDSAARAASLVLVAAAAGGIIWLLLANFGLV